MFHLSQLEGSAVANCKYQELKLKRPLPSPCCSASTCASLKVANPANLSYMFPMKYGRIDICAGGVCIDGEGSEVVYDDSEDTSDAADLVQPAICQ